MLREGREESSRERGRRWRVPGPIEEHEALVASCTFICLRAKTTIQQLLSTTTDASRVVSRSEPCWWPCVACQFRLFPLNSSDRSAKGWSTTTSMLSSLNWKAGRYLAARRKSLEIFLVTEQLSSLRGPTTWTVPVNAATAWILHAALNKSPSCSHARLSNQLIVAHTAMEISAPPIDCSRLELTPRLLSVRSLRQAAQPSEDPVQSHDDNAQTNENMRVGKTNLCSGHSPAT